MRFRDKLTGRYSARKWRVSKMKRLLIAVSFSLLFGLPPLLAVASFAQASQPPITDAANGSIPSEPGMYLQTTGGFNKILGQIVSFTRSGSRLASKLTVGIKTRKENVQLLGPHDQPIVDGKPVFYFIPTRQEADAGVNAGDLASKKRQSGGSSRSERRERGAPVRAFPSLTRFNYSAPRRSRARLSTLFDAFRQIRVLPEEPFLPLRFQTLT